MQKMFGSMMQGFFSNMSAEEKQKLLASFEKMAEMCPCYNMKDMSEKDMGTMMEKMQTFCGSKMGMMSSFSQNAGSSK